jgi:hypothetical protein
LPSAVSTFADVVDAALARIDDKLDCLELLLPQLRGAPNERNKQDRLNSAAAPAWN